MFWHLRAIQHLFFRTYIVKGNNGDHAHFWHLLKLTFIPICLLLQECTHLCCNSFSQLYFKRDTFEMELIFCTLFTYKSIAECQCYQRFKICIFNTTLQKCIFKYSTFLLRVFLLLLDTYIILDGFECDTRIYCSSYDNIEWLGDKSNIVIARAIHSCITQTKKSHIILLYKNYYYISSWPAK